MGHQPRARALSLSVAALMLGVSYRYLAAELSAGRLRGWKQPSYRLRARDGMMLYRQRWRIPESELERWMLEKIESYERATDAERARRRMHFTTTRREYMREYMKDYRRGERRAALGETQR